MATYKKQLHDKDGNTIYPDVGLNLDDVVYSDDPTEPVGDVSPWINSEDIVDEAVTADKIAFNTLDWGNGTTIGNLAGLGSIKIKTFSSTTATNVDTWKKVGNIGSGHTVLGAFGVFYSDGSYAFPGGTQNGEMTGIYVASNGSVNVKSSFSFALGNECRVTVIYI